MSYVSSVEVKNADGTVKRYDFHDKNAEVKYKEGAGTTGKVTCPCEDNTDYSYVYVGDFEMVVKAVRCHGFITFGTKGTVTVNGYAETNGDDINEAQNGETWEFSVWPHDGLGYITWQKKGE